ncbi:Aste57867_15863 [Aphanomyces stellatus]|uniref:Aste57867_15863 protein n=1 Tax=Aphanomyces stellatus TaxID=120398 RepID=A0A485L438_9STRA|nr:hypothetical protein As57867_015807 [Aphanomyces stellatus]VFT92650.1 Aste57867_15863 [Aphanomyces stellatus]
MRENNGEAVNTRGLKFRLYKEMGLRKETSRWKTYWTTMQAYIQSQLSPSEFHAVIAGILDADLSTLISQGDWPGQLTSLPTVAMHNELITAILHNVRIHEAGPSPSAAPAATESTAPVVATSAPKKRPAEPPVAVTHEEAINQLVQVTTSTERVLTDADAEAAASLELLSSLTHKRLKPTLHLGPRQGQKVDRPTAVWSRHDYSGGFELHNPMPVHRRHHPSKSFPINVERIAQHAAVNAGLTSVAPEALRAMQAATENYMEKLTAAVLDQVTLPAHMDPLPTTMEKESLRSLSWPQNPPWGLQALKLKKATPPKQQPKAHGDVGVLVTPQHLIESVTKYPQMTAQPAHVVERIQSELFNPY